MTAAMRQPYQGRQPRVDATAYVHNSAVLIGDVRIGAQSSLWPNVTLRGDDGEIVVGDRTSIQDGSVIHTTAGLSTTTVGNQVTVGHGVILHGCTVHDDCIIGMGAIVLDNAIVHPGSIVGAGAVIPMGKEVPPGTVVVGNPFKVLRAATPKDADWIRHSWNEYVQRTAEYREADRAPADRAPEVDR